MVLKIPPPPHLANADPELNRWLLELQAILNNQGAISPQSIQGLQETETQVAANTSDIATLEGTTGSQGAAINALQTQVNTNTNSITSLNSSVTTLASRNQVWNDIAAPVVLHANGDWFADTSNKHIYVQVAGAWVQIV